MKQIVALLCNTEIKYDPLHKGLSHGKQTPPLILDIYPDKAMYNLMVLQHVLLKQWENSIEQHVSYFVV